MGKSTEIKGLQAKGRECYRRMPAEWEHQSMVQLTWPHRNTDWRPYLDDIVNTMTEIAIAIAERELLLIVTQTPKETAAWLKERMTMNQWLNTMFLPCRTNDTWARDHGFITVCDYPLLERNDGDWHFDFPSPSYKRLLDFKFNGWGNKFPSHLDNAINRRLYQENILDGEYEDHNDFVLEGGSIESDGNGTIFTTKRCLMAPHRNQPLKKDEIEEQLKRRLGAERVNWLHHGRIKGDDTDGHIDTIVRIAPRNTLIYVEQTNEKDPDYNDFLALKTELRRLKTKSGKHYNLESLPTPEPIYDDDGKQLPATYANYLVINGGVIVPIYNQPKYDFQACQTLARIYPDREIIPIDASVIIRQHGSIHCLTMQYY